MNNVQVSKTLVVIDMQRDFAAAKAPWLKQAVLSQIERARRENMAIVILEYLSREPLRFYGETHDDIVKAARGPHFAMRLKAQADGSDCVASACLALGLADQDFVVCGVNTHACVRETVEGLLRLYPTCRIEVVAGACNDYRGNDWSAFPRGVNLTVSHD